ncbi:hypothetical protein [Amycolatopsis jiangsuensis]|uniref:Flagellar basal body-associated protein FliL n=1 Tax=Amycolatopsis jiangsuensis TaxID=1181879 RepID=A0A840IWY6_9PSEU|nr:hypothetical protein [Amycolatopsis jiangsuensis]MBB4687106.1 hypothetical protein [Amycolatopsis jiangsuensis]
MSWQEELRRLDEELASGRLSADDYRIRRDQVLSSAVGQQDQPAAPQQPSNADSTQVIAPVSPPGGTPQQSPQQSPQQNPQQSSPQPVADPGAERTQAVQSWQAQQQSADPGGRTEYVQPGQQPPPYSPPGGFQQQAPSSPAGGFPQAPAPWNAPESDQTPPWGGSDLPPFNSGGGSSEWVSQGPEYFSDKPKSGNGKKIGAIVGAVVVLAAIAFGAFWLWGRDSGGDEPQQNAQPPQQSSSAPKPPDPLAVASMPGQAETHDEITSFSQVDTLTYLNDKELSAYKSAGAGKVKFVVYHLPDGNNITLLLAQTSSKVTAKKAVEQLAGVQTANGAKLYSDTQPGVQATTIDAKDGQSAQVRGHYAHGKVVVRVEVSGKDSASTKTDFATALNQQLTVLTADA